MSGRSRLGTVPVQESQPRSFLNNPGNLWRRGTNQRNKVIELGGRRLRYLATLVCAKTTAVPFRTPLGSQFAARPEDHSSREAH